MEKDTDKSDAKERDFLNRPVDAKIRFRFASIPVTTGLRVAVPPVIADGPHASSYFDEGIAGARKCSIVCAEDLDSCYFCLQLGDIQAAQEPPAVELAEDFYCTDFLALDPRNIQELLQFQRKYGLIQGSRKIKPLVTALEQIRPEPDDSVFAGIYGDALCEQRRGILASQALFDSVPNTEYQEERMLLKLSAVSFREAIATVLDAQRAIRDSTRVLRDDLPSMTNREVANAKVAVDYAAKVLNLDCPSIRLVVEGSPERPTSLMRAVFAQLACGLLTNEAYRTCSNPECGKLFTPRDVGRRLDTRYCSAECQERAKRLRYVARHKAK